MEGLKGTRDFLPEQMRFRRWLEARWRAVAESYGYEEVDGPVLEPLELYTRKSGDEIVRQLYRLTDQGERELALRPDMTPSLARMLGARAGGLPKPIRWYSIPRLFRYERPQRGRLREFFQLNLDIFGVEHVSADAELICAAADALRATGLSDADFRIHVNDRRLVDAVLAARGVEASLRPLFLSAIDKLERSPAGEAEAVLERGGVAPSGGAAVLEIFRLPPEEAVAAFPAGSPVHAAYASLRALRPLVEAGGAGAVLQPNLRIVRGLAYYTGLVFEAYSVAGELRAICGGGRYDDLLAAFGAAPLAAAGFGMGDAVLEEVLLALGRAPDLRRGLDLVVIPAREEDLEAALAVARQCRAVGLTVQTSLRLQPVGKQLRRAAAAGARFAVIVGERERAGGRLRPRDLLRGRDLSEVDEVELGHALRRELAATPISNAAASVL